MGITVDTIYKQGNFCDRTEDKPSPTTTQMHSSVAQYTAASEYLLSRCLMPLRDGRDAGIVKQPCFLRQSNHSYVFSGLFQKVKDEAHYEASHLLCRLRTNIWLCVPSRLSESLLTMAPIMSTEIIGCLSFCRLSVPTGVQLNAPPMSYIWLWEAPISLMTALPPYNESPFLIFWDIRDARHSQASLQMAL